MLNLAAHVSELPFSDVTCYQNWRIVLMWDLRLTSSKMSAFRVFYCFFFFLQKSNVVKNKQGKSASWHPANEPELRAGLVA